jgi:16S rRNA (cytosine967-C5)-methyltransferase
VTRHRVTPRKQTSAAPAAEKGVSARVVALDALLRIEDGAYAHVVVPSILGASMLSSRDRAFATDLVYGTVRAERRIDDLLARVVARPLRRLDPPVRAALRMGAYQLLQGSPPHAAVGETVEALGARSPRAKGFANANLRALTRIGPPWPAADDLATSLSYPDWIVERLTAALGAPDTRAALEAMNLPAPVTLRPNARVATFDALAAELREAGVDVEHGALVPEALMVRGIGDPARLPAVAAGLATPQDQASQAVVAAVAPAPGERIADLAAAPGGKATAIGERVGPEGSVVALDIDAGRNRLVADAASRLALPWVHPVVADGRRPPLAPASFDRVLLDAPCSGLGVLRRRPDARWRLRPEVIDECAALQRELLVAAATLVRPGGLLAYSVCTITPEETLALDVFAAERLSGFGAAPRIGPPWRPHGRGALLLPQDRRTDGMFVLLLQRDEPGVAGPTDRTRAV